MKANQIKRFFLGCVVALSSNGFSFWYLPNMANFPLSRVFANSSIFNARLSLHFAYIEKKNIFIFIKLVINYIKCERLWFDVYLFIYYLPKHSCTFVASVKVDCPLSPDRRLNSGSWICKQHDEHMSFCVDWHLLSLLLNTKTWGCFHVSSVLFGPIKSFVSATKISSNLYLVLYCWATSGWLSMMLIKWLQLSYWSRNAFYWSTSSVRHHI